MRAGELRNRVTIQRLIDPSQTDELGQPLDQWTEVATVWAAVEPLRGRELFAAQQAQSEVTVRVRLRYLAELEPSMRLLCDGRILEIQAVMDPDGRRCEIHALCREVG